MSKSNSNCKHDWHIHLWDDSLDINDGQFAWRCAKCDCWGNGLGDNVVGKRPANMPNEQGDKQ